MEENIIAFFKNLERSRNGWLNELLEKRFKGIELEEARKQCVFEHNSRSINTIIYTCKKGDEVLGVFEYQYPYGNLTAL